MYKFTLVFLLIALFLGCQTKSSKKAASNSDVETSTSNEEFETGRNNYAVIWKWKTDDIQLININTATFAKELITLWQNDEVENVYYDALKTEDVLSYIPSLSFFIKSHSIKEAKNTLDKLTVVEKNMAAYQIFPVGMSWLKIKPEIEYDRGLNKSFVSVWSTIAEKNIGDELSKSQSDTILSLWNNGQIENVYFNLEGISKENDKTDFVFFINSESIEDAEAICNSLPFFKENIASFKLYKAGAFWMGEFKE